MSTSPRLLLIGTCDYWQQVLQKATKSLGVLEVATAEEAEERVREHDYVLIIEDAVHIEDENKLAKTLRCIKSDARIVIVTASPTWTRAREAFKSGVVDYLPRILDEERLQTELETAMHRMLPPYGAHNYTEE
ncbi:MAG: hypothetical protein JW963_20180 [Anaerolineales bacterium]|nr:hypothetical protein [Anaerolineales bacterium]